MSDYLRREFDENIDVKIRKFHELQKEINLEIERIRPYVNSSGAYAVKQITDSMNQTLQSLKDLKQSI